MAKILPSFFNLAVLVGILFYYLKKPLRDWVFQRHHSTKKELEDVANLLKQAQKDTQDLQIKLRTLDQEVAALHEQYRSDAIEASARVLKEAQQLSSRIVADSSTAAQAMISDLRQQMLTEIGNRVLDRAETLLRDKLTRDDRVRIRQEFSQQMGGAA